MLLHSRPRWASYHRSPGVWASQAGHLGWGHSFSVPGSVDIFSGASGHLRLYLGTYLGTTEVEFYLGWVGDLELRWISGWALIVLTKASRV